MFRRQGAGIKLRPRRFESSNGVLISQGEINIVKPFHQAPAGIAIYLETAEKSPASNALFR